MNKELSRKNQGGFTLIELILVVAVSSILLMGILTIFNPLDQIAKSNDTKRKSDLVQIQNVLEAYYQDNGRYPATSGSYTLTTKAIIKADWGTSYTPYMNVLPKDPSSSRTYVYVSPSGGQSYYLYASLERGTKDLQACNNGNACATLGTSGFPAQDVCGSTCNFGLSSPDTRP